MLNTKIILVHPTHPGNIGATARAMKNMGLSQLTLVQPKQFPHAEATVRASGADDILANVVVCDPLEQALVDCQIVLGTSARDRRLEWPSCTPRAAAKTISELPKECRAAIVFGRESSGLTNDELALCHTQIHIPTVAHFSSLNLSAAVQLIAYEIYLQSCANEQHVLLEQHVQDLASVDDLNGFFKQLQETMIDVNFLDMRQPRKLMHRLRRLFQRAQLSTTEIHILRGFLSAVDKKIN